MGYTKFSTENFCSRFCGRETTVETAGPRFGMRKGRIVHGASLLEFLIFCKKLPPEPFPSGRLKPKANHSLIDTNRPAIWGVQGAHAFLKDEHADGGRQVGVTTRGVDHRRETIEGQATLGRDQAQPSPKRILEGDAGSMSGDDQRAFDDARVAVSRHRALRGGERRGSPRRARARFRQDASQPSSDRRQRGFAPLPLAGALAPSTFGLGAD
jgi:hypothetical protein